MRGSMLTGRRLGMRGLWRVAIVCCLFFAFLSACARGSYLPTPEPDQTGPSAVAEAQATPSRTTSGPTPTPYVTPDDGSWWRTQGATVPPAGYPVSTGFGSSDGWHLSGTLLPSVIPGASLVTAIEALPDRLVAVGTTAYPSGDSGSSGYGGVVWTSLDGNTWVRTDASFPTCQLRTAESSQGSIWVGGDCDGQASIWKSADGASWEPASLPAADGDAKVLRIAVDGESFVAFGVEGRTTVAWHSSDGLTWTKAILPAVSGDSAVLAVVRYRFGWTALMTIGNAIWPISSPDGSNWTRGSAPLPLPNKKSTMSPFVSDLVSFGGKLIAVGRAETTTNWGAVAWTSTDGRAWTAAVAPTIARDAYDDTEIDAALATDRGVIAVGTGGTWSTLDGRTWTIAPAGAGGYDGGDTWVNPMFTDVTAFEGHLYAVAQFGEAAIADMGAPANPSVWRIVSPVG